MKHKMKTHSGYQWTLQLCCAHTKTTKTESVEPELKNVREKSQDKNELILHNTIIYAR